jgi:hypothetical protein
MQAEKPILFLFSSKIPLENVYFLKDVGSVINLQEAPVDLVMQYESKDFLICNMRSDDQIQKLKFVDLDKCLKVALLRNHESVNEPWVERLHADYRIKDFSFVDNCKTKQEILNTIKAKSVLKKPDSNIMFYLKKLYAVLSCVFSSS